MSKKSTISKNELNKALKSMNERAIRTNRALGLDTVYVEGRNVIRERADGSLQKIGKLSRGSSATKEPLETD